MKLSEARANWLIRLFGILAFVSFVVVRQYCTRCMPEVASAEVGRVFALEVNYGKTVYLTASELRYVHYADGVVIVLGSLALGVILLRSWQEFSEGMKKNA